MSEPQDILRRAALKHILQGGKCTSGSMGIDMDLILSGLVAITSDGNLAVTDAGRAFLASAMSTGTAKTPQAVEGQSPASAVGEAETPDTPTNPQSPHQQERAGAAPEGEK